MGEDPNHEAGDRLAEAERADDDRQAEHPAVPDADPSPYGFGHPAHRPDPHASYGFEPGKWRTLPTEQRRRWRVTG